MAHYEEELMFAPYCDTHEKHVLLPTEAITDLVSTPGGMMAHFVCHCGATGVWRPDIAHPTGVR